MVRKMTAWSIVLMSMMFFQGYAADQNISIDTDSDELEKATASMKSLVQPDKSEPARGRSVLDQLQEGSKVALQLMQLKSGAQDVSSKALFICRVKKSLPKKKFPGRWRLPDSGTYYGLKQVVDLAKEPSCQFIFHKKDNNVGFEFANGKNFISIHRKHKRVPTTKGGLIKKWVKSDDGSVLVDDESDNFDKYSSWVFEPDEEIYGRFRLRSTVKEAEGYLCAPDDRWDYGSGILWVATNQDKKDKDNFERAKKNNALVLKIVPISGPSIKAQTKAPVRTTQSALLNRLNKDSVVVITLPMNEAAYLKADGKKVVLTGTSPSDKACQFKVLKDNEFIGFKSVTSGKTIQVKDNHEAELNKDNFKDSEKWSCETIDTLYPRSYVRLRNKERKGYACIDPKSRQLITKKDNRPAVKDEAQIFRMIDIRDLDRSVATISPSNQVLSVAKAITNNNNKNSNNKK